MNKLKFIEKFDKTLYNEILFFFFIIRYFIDDEKKRGVFI